MSAPLRVALIGAGIADKHAAAFRQLPRQYELVALCSLDEERGRAVCERHGIPRYVQDAGALMQRGDIDLVDICTPPASHFELCSAALRAGMHVVCEKPLFGSLAELDTIAALQRECGRELMPIFQYRYGAGLQKLRALVAAGLAGRPIMSTVETHWWRGPEYYAVPWRGRWASELGGGLLGHAIHAHDMLCHVHGDIAEVFAYGATLVNPIEVEDTAALALKMANGSLATLSMTLGSRQQVSRLRFCFSGLTAESSLEPYAPGRDPWRFTAADEARQAEVDRLLAALPVQHEGFVRQFELFHQALVSGAEPPVTLGDARRSLELVTAAYHSQRTGHAVALPLGAQHPLYRSWLP